MKPKPGLYTLTIEVEVADLRDKVRVGYIGSKVADSLASLKREGEIVRAVVKHEDKPIWYVLDSLQV